MARGITESDVHTSADELVAKGERPTVGRTRAHLGTGSPNTVTRWLGTWWNRLGTRLQPRRSDFDDAPAVLAELAGQWWELALKHAREATLREFAETELSLATQRDALDARSRVVADELSQMRSERAAIAGERLVSTQATELERLVDQLRLQISGLTEQRDLELRRADRSEAARQQLDALLNETLETAKSEREDWTEYVRSVENRTLSELDRSRQEAKDLQTQLNNQAKAQREIEEQLRKELHPAQSAAISAGQATDVLRGRCEALEQQLSSLRQLPAQLEAAFKRNARKEAAPTSRPRRQSPRST
ncbi:cointegrate resolution protein T [Stenotrophomonas maltophilia]|uniref:Cointegrate resolution protein T n=1 Tax=Stenotrophomonas maltophilia TaxID=40324 RepID=A0A1A6XXY7_STEMA|nr:DNA-binding protein [Stenotrophomonas maltophilia]OBU68447.1 cointegrate resolution protein T [Stenotrophomonas maltophilia]